MLSKSNGMAEPRNISNNGLNYTQNREFMLNRIKDIKKKRPMQRWSPTKGCNNNDIDGI